MLVLVLLAIVSVSGRDGRWLMKVSTCGSLQVTRRLVDLLSTSRTSAFGLFGANRHSLHIFPYVLIMTL